MPDSSGAELTVIPVEMSTMYNTWVRTRVRARAGYKLFQGMEIKCTFLSTDLYKRRREVNHMNELYMTSILLCHLCWRS